MTEALSFLAAVFPEIPAGSVVQLWTLPSKTSTWYESPEAAAKAAVKMAPTSDVYIGVGLRQKGIERGKRGELETVTAVPGLWADLDLAGPGHTKKKLPATELEVEQFLAELPFVPTIRVLSGGGVHCWWLFRELLETPTVEARRQATALSKGWSDFLRRSAERRGWTIDSTFDLTRVLRVPGTWNHKGGERRAVKLLELAPGRRYNPSDFESYAAQIVESLKNGLGGVTLAASADPPFDKFQALLEIEPKFKASWNRKRKDLPDQSGSSYDLSLATFAAGAGWTDQEIVNLLIASRRKHGDSLKLREDYYARTVARARSGIELNATIQDLGDELERAAGSPPEQVPPTEPGGEPGTRAAVDPKTREGALALIAELTGLPVRRVLCFGRERGQYQLELEDGRTATLGDLDAVKKFSTWWNLAFELTRRAPLTEPKRPKWLQALACLQPIVETFASEDVEAVTMLLEQLRRYVARAVDLTKLSEGSESRAEIVREGLPFRDGDRYFVSLQAFRRHLLLERERVEPKELLGLFRMADLKAEKVQLWCAGGNVSRRYWIAQAERLA